MKNGEETHPENSLKIISSKKNLWPLTFQNPTAIITKKLTEFP